ncbi:MAG: hypothetical protein M1837_005286 [Sclerophora amabilis]|nr:MAG: hypothetical protein M1837_005286 [Sclerophora amabilis]
MPGTAGRATDYFHVSCFEKMVNLSQSYILDRLLPLTRHVMADCRLESVLVHQGLYLCDGGTERLVQEWIAQRKRWIAERNGIQEEISNFALYYLSQMAGSSTFVPQLVPGLTRREEARLQVDLAPFESDGPGDEQEWNLFTSYLTPDNHRATLHDRHNLSNMLRCWAHDVDLVIRPDFKITPAQRQEKDRLGEKAIRAITRLARVPLPE